jgi:hypothetical protein
MGKERTKEYVIKRLTRQLAKHIGRGDTEYRIKRQDGFEIPERVLTRYGRLLHHIQSLKKA